MPAYRVSAELDLPARQFLIERDSAAFRSLQAKLFHLSTMEFGKQWREGSVHYVEMVTKPSWEQYIPKAVERMAKRYMRNGLVYVDILSYDADQLAEPPFVINIKSIPPVFADRAGFDSRLIIEELPGGRCRQILEGCVEVRVGLGLGKMVEGIIVNTLQKIYRNIPQAVEQWAHVRRNMLAWPGGYQELLAGRVDLGHVPWVERCVTATERQGLGLPVDADALALLQPAGGDAWQPHDSRATRTESGTEYFEPAEDLWELEEDIELIERPQPAGASPPSSFRRRRSGALSGAGRRASLAGRRSGSVDLKAGRRKSLGVRAAAPAAQPSGAELQSAASWKAVTASATALMREKSQLLGARAPAQRGEAALPKPGSDADQPPATPMARAGRHRRMRPLTDVFSQWSSWEHHGVAPVRWRPRMRKGSSAKSGKAARKGAAAQPPAYPPPPAQQSHASLGAPGRAQGPAPAAAGPAVRAVQSCAGSSSSSSMSTLLPPAEFVQPSPHAGAVGLGASLAAQPAACELGMQAAEARSPAGSLGGSAGSPQRAPPEACHQDFAAMLQPEWRSRQPPATQQPNSAAAVQADSLGAGLRPTCEGPGAHRRFDSAAELPISPFAAHAATPFGAEDTAANAAITAHANNASGSRRRGGGGCFAGIGSCGRGAAGPRTKSDAVALPAATC